MCLCVYIYIYIHYAYVYICTYMYITMAHSCSFCLFSLRFKISFLHSTIFSLKPSISLHFSFCIYGNPDYNSTDHTHCHIVSMKAGERMIKCHLNIECLRTHCATVKACICWKVVSTLYISGISLAILPLQLQKSMHVLTRKYKERQ